MKNKSFCRPTTIWGMTPEEMIKKVKSGEIPSRKYDSFDDFLKALK